MSEPKKTIDHVTLRSYPKVIFLWPLLLVSFVLFLLQLLDPGAEIEAIYGLIWMITFFVNLFILALDFSSAKFFVLVVIVIIFILLFVFFIMPYLGTWAIINFFITWQFYGMIALILAILWGLTWIATRFDYYKIERNEIYHKTGIFTSAERLPTKSLRIKKEIPDVFEFFLLRAGRITLLPGHGDVIPLPNILNINKKEKQIDWLLSHISIEPDELDL